MSTPSPEPAQETWTSAGVRVSTEGKRQHAWLDPSGEELLFRQARGATAVGSHYTALVIRRVILRLCVTRRRDLRRFVQDTVLEEATVT